MVARHETGGLWRPLVMQFNSHRHQRARTKDLPVIRWLIFVQPSSAMRRRTVVPAHALRYRHCCRSCAGFGSILGVEDN